MAISSKWECDICNKVGSGNGLTSPDGWSDGIALVNGNKILLDNIIVCNDCLGVKVINGKAKINLRFVLDKILYLFRRSKQ